MKKAFTLIELSIVIVIIGLIVGGVLVGRDLIAAAEIRATVGQVEKYQTAVNTFRTKYNVLPGDMLASTASQFGFAARAGTAGQGDGDGIIQGGAYGWNGCCESLLFWRDLSQAQLIDGSFATAADGNIGAISSNFDLYVPRAKLSNNYFTVYSGCSVGSGCLALTTPSASYLALSGIAILNTAGSNATTLQLSPIESYNIDTKIDDGIPNKGRLKAFIVNTTLGPAVVYWSTNSATADATTCFDTTSNSYSVGQNGGNGKNCSLSFRF